MRIRFVFRVALGALGMFVGTVHANDEASGESPEQRVAQRALRFLAGDAAKWRQDRGCATCHHGTMTVWALSEAQRQGYEVDTGALANVMQWAKDQFVPQFRGPRDLRPGYDAVSVPAIYLSVMSQELPVLSRQEINQVVVHLVRHQEADGVWAVLSGANTVAPTWESPETLALLAYLAWEEYVPEDSVEADRLRAGRRKLLRWLATTKSTETTQAETLRLVLDVRNGASAEQLSAQVDRLLKRQESDGGFRQIPALPSDAYATGQALWALSLAGVKKDRPEIQRAVSFLVASQRDDGSWPMTSRKLLDVSKKKRIHNPVPITYFGSAWATIGLVRFVPPPLNLATRRRRAFDAIRMYAGTPRADETALGRPVESVKLLYEVDDQELEKLTSLLTVFPDLTTLELVSPKISDAALPSLKVLTRLRSLSLENAAVTDAGLAHLAELPTLEELNLKGTRVTDTGVQKFQKTSPRTRVVR
jgi:hypothetical protein